MSAEHAASREGQFIVVTVFGAKRGAHARAAALELLNDGESLAQMKVEHPMYWFEAIAPPDPWELARNRDDYVTWQQEVRNGDTLLGWMDWLAEVDARVQDELDEEGGKLDEFDRAESEAPGE